MFRTLRSRALVLPAALLLLGPRLQGQTAQPPSHVIFWLAAGPALVSASAPESILRLPEEQPGLTLSGTLQSGHLVLSARAAVVGLSPVAAWDAALLAGAGTSTVPAVYGSVAAGIGLTTVPGSSTGLSFPLEAQVGWRLTPSFGLGLYGFGSFGGPDDFLGVGLALRVGRLR